MFTPKPSTNVDGLENAIDDLLDSLKKHQPDSEEYTTSVANLETLYKLKEVDTPGRISRDTLAIIGGNLVGVLLIVGYERANVITSKAGQFLLKLR